MKSVMRGDVDGDESGDGDSLKQSTRPSLYTPPLSTTTRTNASLYLPASLDNTSRVTLIGEAQAHEASAGYDDTPSPPGMSQKSQAAREDGRPNATPCRQLERWDLSRRMLPWHPMIQTQDGLGGCVCARTGRGDGNRDESDVETKG
ncbi:hypothetical protein J3458_012945 [Metarhizium acridum]|uniref:uncharacterized protein n=1 Tax=Metarhizium acridum TaxID=92637 RepID=UPI001C6BDA0D|nr:hypothetical protein J3458_012945 [Metarhizium acridum]